MYTLNILYYSRVYMFKNQYLQNIKKDLILELSLLLLNLPGRLSVQYTLHTLCKHTANLVQYTLHILYNTHRKPCTIHTAHLVQYTQNTLYPGLENNDALKCQSAIFPTTLIYVVVLENDLSNIGMYGCAPIQGTRLKLLLKFDEARISDCNIQKMIKIFFFVFLRNLIKFDFVHSKYNRELKQDITSLPITSPSLHRHFTITSFVCLFI